MMTDTRDHTPVTVTLPAYTIKPILNSLKWHATRLRTRATLRGDSLNSVDRLIANTVDEAAAMIVASIDHGRR